MDDNLNPIDNTPNVEPNSNGVPGSLPNETPAETQARLYKVTVDGEELEVDEAELRKGYAHNRAAGKRMEEASRTRKEAEQVLRILKENPRQAMQKLGLSPRDFAEMIINEDLQEAMLDPRDRELRDYKQKLETYQRSEREAREAYEQEQRDAEMAKYTEQIQSDIIGTLATSGLPATERTVSRIAYYMQAALQAGFENVRPADVIDHVKRDYQFDLKQMLGGLSEDQIEAFLDGDIVRKIAKSTVKKSPAPKPVAREVNANRPERKDDKKTRSPKDFFDRSF